MHVRCVAIWKVSQLLSLSASALVHAESYAHHAQRDSSKMGDGQFALYILIAQQHAGALDVVVSGKQHHVHPEWQSPGC